MDNVIEKRGEINLIIGPMFSAKTETLLAKVRRVRFTKKKYILVKYKGDTRYDKDSIITHSGLKEECSVLEHCEEIDFHAKDVEYIFIDEFMMFKNIAEFSKKWSFQGKKVFLAGLDAYANQIMWEETTKIIPWADTLLKLTSICNYCGEAANLTEKIRGQEMEIEIGGMELYKACCNYCMMNKK